MHPSSKWICRVIFLGERFADIEGYDQEAGGIKRLRLVRYDFSHRGDARIRYHNGFICVGVDISIHVLLTGGRI